MGKKEQTDNQQQQSNGTAVRKGHAKVPSISQIPELMQSQFVELSNIDKTQPLDLENSTPGQKIIKMVSNPSSITPEKELEARMTESKKDMSQQQVEQNAQTVTGINQARASLSLASPREEIAVPIEGFRGSCLILLKSRISQGVLLIATFLEIAAYLMHDYSYRTTGEEPNSLTINLVAYIFEILSNIAFSVELILLGIAKSGTVKTRKELLNLQPIILTLILICSWISVGGLDSTVIEIIKHFRILTIFRLFPELQKKVSAFFGSFKHLGKTFFPLACVIFFYAIIGISFFKGHVESRCRLTEFPEDGKWEASELLEHTCGYLECPEGLTCGNPADYDIPANHEEYDVEDFLWGYSNFNDISNALFSVYNHLMVNGWISTTQIYWRAQDKTVSGIYFVSLVLLLSQIFSNIVLATLYEGFVDSSEIKKQMGESQKIPSASVSVEKTKNLNKPDTIFQKDKIHKKHKRAGNGKHKTMEHFLPQLNNQNNQMKKKKSMFQMILNSQISNVNNQRELELFEQSTTNTSLIVCLKIIRLIFKRLSKSSVFHMLTFLQILGASLTLAIDNVSLTDNQYINLNKADFAFSIILLFEVMVEFISMGFKKYFSSSLNILDMSIAILHVFCFIAEPSLGFSMFGNLKIYIQTYYQTLRSLPEFLIVFVMLILLFAQIGREIFANVQISEDSAEGTEEKSHLRVNYDSLEDSLIAVTMIFFNEEWHITMYEYRRLVGYKSVLFHLICMLICQVLYIRLFIAIFISHFMIWLRQYETEYRLSQPYQNSFLKLFHNIFNKNYFARAFKEDNQDKTETKQEEISEKNNEYQDGKSNNNNDNNKVHNQLLTEGKLLNSSKDNIKNHGIIFVDGNEATNHQNNLNKRDSCSDRNQESPHLKANIIAAHSVNSQSSSPSKNQEQAADFSKQQNHCKSTSSRQQGNDSIKGSSQELTRRPTTEYLSGKKNAASIVNIQNDNNSNALNNLNNNANHAHPAIDKFQILTPQESLGEQQLIQDNQEIARNDNQHKAHNLTVEDNSNPESNTGANNPGLQQIRSDRQQLRHAQQQNMKQLRQPSQQFQQQSTSPSLPKQLNIQKNQVNHLHLGNQSGTRTDRKSQSSSDFDQIADQGQLYELGQTEQGQLDDIDGKGFLDLQKQEQFFAAIPSNQFKNFSTQQPDTTQFDNLPQAPRNLTQAEEQSIEKQLILHPNISINSPLYAGILQKKQQQQLLSNNSINYSAATQLQQSSTQFIFNNGNNSNNNDKINNFGSSVYHLPFKQQQSSMSSELLNQENKENNLNQAPTFSNTFRKQTQQLKAAILKDRLNENQEDYDHISESDHQQQLQDSNECREAEKIVKQISLDNSHKSLKNSQNLNEKDSKNCMNSKPLQMSTSNPLSNPNSLILKKMSTVSSPDNPLDLSFFMFSPKSDIRVFSKTIVEHQLFDFFMVLSIITMAITLAIDSPFLNPQSAEKETLKIIAIFLTTIFLAEVLLQSIAYGFIFSETSFIRRSPLNIVDFITSIASLFYAVNFWPRRIFIFKFLLILRITILLSFLSKPVKDIRFAGKTIMKCLPRMMRLLFFAILFLFVTGVLATKLLKGSMYSCSFSEEKYSTELVVNDKWDCLDQGGDWIDSMYNFNNIFNSLSILFMVQSSEGWITIMFAAYDSTSKDAHSHTRYQSLWSVFFIQFFFIANICILNMFVGLVVETQQEMIEQEHKTKDLQKFQKEWLFIKKSIYKLTPIPIEKVPTNVLRKFIYQHLIAGYPLKVLFYCFTITNCLSFTIFSNRQSLGLQHNLVTVNGVCLAAMSLEMLLKLFSMGTDYFKDNWNVYDILPVSFGWVNYGLQTNYSMTTFSMSLRIFDGVAKGIQLLRFYRIMRHFTIVKKLFKSLQYAISSIFGIFLVMVVFLYMSVLLCMNLFPFLKYQKTINGYDIHFKTFFSSLFALIRVMTSETWYPIPSEASKYMSPNFVCRDDIVLYEDYEQYGQNACGTGFSFLFFYGFVMIFTLVILNIFIATIIESYKEAFSADESAVNHYQLGDVLELWKTYDPEGKGYISYKEFWQFSSQIAIIYGVESEELRDISNKNKFLKTLNIPIFEDPVNRIFCYKFHDVVIALSKISVQIKYGITNLEPEDEILRGQLEKLIVKSHLKGDGQIKPTEFTSADMVLLIVLTRKVKQWKNKFLRKDEEDFVFDIRNLTNKLRLYIQQQEEKEKADQDPNMHAIVTLQEVNDLKSSANRPISSKEILDEDRNHSQGNQLVTEAEHLDEQKQETNRPAEQIKSITGLIDKKEESSLLSKKNSKSNNISKGVGVVSSQKNISTRSIRQKEANANKQEEESFPMKETSIGENGDNDREKGDEKIPVITLGTPEKSMLHKKQNEIEKQAQAQPKSQEESHSNQRLNASSQNPGVIEIEKNSSSDGKDETVPLSQRQQDLPSVTEDVKKQEKSKKHRLEKRLKHLQRKFIETIPEIIKANSQIQQIDDVIQENQDDFDLGGINFNDNFIMAFEESNKDQNDSNQKGKEIQQDNEVVLINPLSIEDLEAHSNQGASNNSSNSIKNYANSLTHIWEKDKDSNTDTQKQKEKIRQEPERNGLSNMDLDEENEFGLGFNQQQHLQKKDIAQASNSKATDKETVEKHLNPIEGNGYVNDDDSSSQENYFE